MVFIKKLSNLGKRGLPDSGAISFTKHRIRSPPELEPSVQKPHSILLCHSETQGYDMNFLASGSFPGLNVPGAALASLQLLPTPGLEPQLTTVCRGSGLGALAHKGYLSPQGRGPLWPRSEC